MTNSINACWDALKQDWARLQDVHLREMFDQSPDRFDDHSVSLDDLTLDFSKERIDTAATKNLLELAKASDVEQARDAMFAGARINKTEDRAVMHIALRANQSDNYEIDGEATNDLVEAELSRFLIFAEDVRSGKITNAKGQSFTDVINIGIGGSDLGPAMAIRALRPFTKDGPNVHFVSNVDGADFEDTTAGLNPATTLVLVASKTFTTIETLTNAKLAVDWLKTELSDAEFGQNLAALSTNLEGTQKFGIADDHVFGFWDWVGGRYSICSSIGLSLAIGIGSSNFQAFLNGFRDMDQHFKTAPLAENLPVQLALHGIWRRNIMNCPTMAIIPYSQRLDRFVAYVQQMDMESNGKQVTLDGSNVTAQTSPVIWGEPGTNAQHSFFQLVHQGTDIIPVDFLIAAKSGTPFQDSHDLLVSNQLAQAQALALGKTEDEVRDEMLENGAAADRVDDLAPHRTFPGNRPSTSIVYKQLDPYSLGRLIALYEHKVFVQGVIWGVNSFDQWGVELGKVLAKQIQPYVSAGADDTGVHAATKRLLQNIKSK